MTHVTAVRCLSVDDISKLLTPVDLSYALPCCSNQTDCRLYLYQRDPTLRLRAIPEFPYGDGLCVLCYLIDNTRHLLERMVYIQDKIAEYDDEPTNFVRMYVPSEYLRELNALPFDFSDGHGFSNAIDISLMPNKIVVGGFPVCHMHEFVWASNGQDPPRMYLSGATTQRVAEWADCVSHIDTRLYTNGYAWGSFLLATRFAEADVSTSYSSVAHHVREDATVRIDVIFDYHRRIAPLNFSEYNKLIECVHRMRRGADSHDTGTFASWAPLVTYVDKIIKDTYLGRQITHADIRETDSLICGHASVYQSPPPEVTIYMFDAIVDILHGTGIRDRDAQLMSALRASPESFRLCVHLAWLLSPHGVMADDAVSSLCTDTEIGPHHCAFVRDMIAGHPLMPLVLRACSGYSAVLSKKISLLGLFVFGSEHLVSFCAGGHLVLSRGVLDMGELSRHVHYSVKMDHRLRLRCCDDVCRKSAPPGGHLVTTVTAPFFLFGLATFKVRRPDITTDKRKRRSGGYFIIQPAYYMCVPINIGMKCTPDGASEITPLLRTVYNADTESFLGVENVSYCSIAL